MTRRLCHSAEPSVTAKPKRRFEQPRYTLPSSASNTSLPECSLLLRLKGIRGRSFVLTPPLQVLELAKGEGRQEHTESAIAGKKGEQQKASV
ncbi:hypothetical protein ECG_03169 [Echinococcus granulosus]|uniref:Uncharacterized protein n=1 Tax=Echinococcus granulosus TaxID=6210 RepID=A0A068WN29_ECHGR|nr:hypothetical protein ECG_03169 [Echinococcus granulosus]CDS19858.1 hypothetical protein EgrG_000202900 [Echinococcus granulosus]